MGKKNTQQAFVRLSRNNAVDKNEFSDLTDHELVDAYGQTGNPWANEMLKAEERRRTAERALAQATK